jgi:hypothetical protein
MEFVTLFLIAVGLSMDAFSVAICKGLSMPRATAGKCSIVGLWFGGFQGLMPIVGYFLGVGFRYTIENFDHWIMYNNDGYQGYICIEPQAGRSNGLNDGGYIRLGAGKTEVFTTRVALG